MHKIIGFKFMKIYTSKKKSICLLLKTSQHRLYNQGSIYFYVIYKQYNYNTCINKKNKNVLSVHI